MLEWARVIHEAVGIESPRAFIALCAAAGALVFGIVGWLIDKGYRVKMREQSAHAAYAPVHPLGVPPNELQAEASKKAPTLTRGDQRTHARPTTKADGSAKAPLHIEQHSEGPNSPNIVGNGNTIISGPIRRNLTPQAVERMKAALVAFQGQEVKVLIPGSDLRFGAQLVDALRGSGWSAVPETAQILACDVVTGIAVLARAKSPALDALVAFLQREGLSPRFVVHEEVPEGAIHICIASAPQG